MRPTLTLREIEGTWQDSTGRVWQRLPEKTPGRKPVNFEGYAGLRAYRIIGKRAPRRGEFYLSGAIPAAYRAPNDLTMVFQIVEPLAPLVQPARFMGEAR